MGVKISNLPVIVTPALTDVFPVVQAGVTYKESGTQFSSLFATAGANTNITSLGGLTTPLSLAQGGTASTTGVVAGSVAPASGAGIPVQVIFFGLTSTTSIASAVAVSTGVTATITPTAATSKILVRAVINYCMVNTDNGFMQIVRNATPIGIGDAAGSRTRCGNYLFSEASFLAQETTAVLEWLDSPATTSATTYTVQMWTSGGNQSYINRSITDTDSASIGRSVSTITLMEIK